MADLTADPIFVSDVIAQLAEDQGLNMTVDENIDDLCYGAVIASDKSTIDFLKQHQGPYNYVILDGDPIRIKRILTNDQLVVDLAISEGDCVMRSGQPAIVFKRADPATLPSRFELQYIDIGREFAITTQLSHHRRTNRRSAKSFTLKSSAASLSEIHSSHAVSNTNIDMVLTGDQARLLAFQTLWRTWYQSTSVGLEIFDLRVEPGDVLALTCRQGVFLLAVHEQTITKDRTNNLLCFMLLSSLDVTELTAAKGNILGGVTGGTANSYVSMNDDQSNAGWVAGVL